MQKLFNFLIIVILLVISGCGKKTSPVPIEKSVPVGFSFKLKPEWFGIRLMFKLPYKTKGGDLLTSIKFILVEKQSVSQGKKMIFKIYPDLHSSARTYIYDDVKVKSGECYYYRIKIVKGIFVSTPFTRALKVCWVAPPLPPKEVKIKVLNKNFVLIKWKKGKNKEVFYQIKKMTPRGVKLITTYKNFFIDRVSGGENCYQVRGVVEFKDNQIPGIYSPLTCIIF